MSLDVSLASTRVPAEVQTVPSDGPERRLHRDRERETGAAAARRTSGHHRDQQDQPPSLTLTDNKYSNAIFRPVSI